MRITDNFLLIIFIFLSFSAILCYAKTKEYEIKLNDMNYFSTKGFDVIVFDDFYPEGHQSGITIIHHGVRVAANGDIRLQAAPGQWEPVPKLINKKIIKEKNQIMVSLYYPDPDRNRKGFNPIIYPDLKLEYKIRVYSKANKIIIEVDLNNPLPDKWAGKVGFNLELYPAEFSGKHYIMDNKTGLFPPQFTSSINKKDNSEVEVIPMATGKSLTIAPEDPYRKLTINALIGNLELIDGRARHNNGWFIVSSKIGKRTKNVIKWEIIPNIVKDWFYKPVIHVSQIGYLPNQQKIAVIETDKDYKSQKEIKLIKIETDGNNKIVFESKPESWGKFLRYNYYKFDFSKIKEEGIYFVKWDDYKSNCFRISKNVFDKDVWQPTLSYFLPIQMCHMRVEDRYRVWHDLCHMDDALMAPTDTIHFDGYRQGPSTLTRYKPYEHVPGLNAGGWHDAGDYDLRIESQAGTVRSLSIIYELFKIEYDQTTIDQDKHLVILNEPDGIPDILQQIENGLITIINGYKSLGRFYRGIICPTLKQYVLLGDARSMTDNKIYNSDLNDKEIRATESHIPDDRWVFTEENPYRELYVAACLAQAYRVMKKYKPKIANECLDIAKTVFENYKDVDGRAVISKIEAASELLLSTGEEKYRQEIIQSMKIIKKHFNRIGWIVSRTLPLINDKEFEKIMRKTVKKYRIELDKQLSETPFGIPFHPHIWGAAWGLENLAVRLYFLHKSFPEIIPKEPVERTLDYLLGVHPGKNTSSLVSGVGVKSATIAYGFNRADWSYIPGGVISGPNLIRPDLPELKEFPYLWQQSEYVIGGAASNFIFLIFAIKELNQK